MFRKERDLDQRTSSSIKKKDLKKLKADLARQLQCSEDILDCIFYSKCSVNCTKLANHTLVYSVDSVPYFFDAAGRCDIYPTVFALWKVPKLLPQIIIHSGVSPHLLRGADLMAPGVCGMNEVNKGDKISVCVRKNAMPFAVGLAELSYSDIDSQLSPKGIAACIKHTFGDCLWKSASFPIPNDGFSTLSIVSEDSLYDTDIMDPSSCSDFTDSRNAKEDTEEKDDTNGDGTNEAGLKEGNAMNDTEHSQKQVDKYLLIALLCTLKYLVKDRDLPVLVSKLWNITKKVVSCRHLRDNGASQEADSPPDIKNSSFSKVSQFIHHAGNTLGVVDIEEVGKGVEAVVRINRQHELYKEWKNDIYVDDPDNFRQEVNQNDLDTDTSVTSAVPSLNMRASELFPGLSLGKTIRAIVVFKMTRDLRKEFRALGSEYEKEDKFFLASQVDELAVLYMKTHSLECSSSKKDVEIPPSNFFFNAIRRESSKHAKSNAQKSNLQDETATPTSLDGLPDYNSDSEPVCDEGEAVHDSLSKYTVIGGVIMPSSLSTSPDPSVKESKATSESRRSNIPGGWGANPGKKWKPIELPKEKPSTMQSQIDSKRASRAQSSQKESCPSLPPSPVTVSKELFMKTLKQKFTTYYAIIFPTGECVIGSGSAPSITVEVEMRKGNKVVTKVCGLEAYHFDVEHTAKQLQKEFACSTTVAPKSGKSNVYEIILQGNWANKMEKYLVEKKSLQKQLIKTSISAKVKAKKK